MNLIMNELPQIRPVLFVQAGNVVSVDVGEVGFRHGSCTPVPSTFLPQSRATQKFCNRDQNLRKRSGHVPPFVTVPSNQVLRMGLSGKDALRMSASSTHRTLAPSRFHPTQRYDSIAAGGSICRICSGPTKRSG